MTAKAPEQRYQTASEVAAALQTWLDNSVSGQSSRISAIKAAALRSRQRGIAAPADAEPKAAASADLELAPMDDQRVKEQPMEEQRVTEQPAEKQPAEKQPLEKQRVEEQRSSPTVSTRAASGSTRRSRASEKDAPPQADGAPGGLAPAIPAPIPASPRASPAGSAEPSAVAYLLAELPFGPDPSQGPPKALRDISHEGEPWWQPVARVIGGSPWLWAAVVGLLLVVAVLVFLVLGPWSSTGTGGGPKSPPSPPASTSRVQGSGEKPAGSNLPSAV